MFEKIKNKNGNNEIESLIALLAKLPGFGKRSARRAVLHMINKRESLMQPITKQIAEVYNKVSKYSTVILNTYVLLSSNNLD